MLLLSSARLYEMKQQSAHHTMVWGLKFDLIFSENVHKPLLYRKLFKSQIYPSFVPSVSTHTLPRHWGETDLPHSIMYHVLFYSSSWLIPLGPTFQLHVLLFLTFLQESEVQLHSNIPVYSLHGCILYCTYVPDVIFLELLHWEVRTAFIPSW